MTSAPIDAVDAKRNRVLDARETLQHQTETDGNSKGYNRTKIGKRSWEADEEE